MAPLDRIDLRTIVPHKGALRRDGQVSRIKTYRHSEDRLLGLVNVTLSHYDGCEENRELRKKKKK